MNKPLFTSISLVVAFFSICVFLRCGTPEEKEPEQTPPQEGGTTKTEEQAAGASGPSAAVRRFLEATRTGNDQVATEMLTRLARESIEELGGSVAPPSSDTARFRIGEVEMLAEDGARVPCVWTDLDADNQEKSYHMLWMVRKEPEGWRIAGMATEVFEGEPPLVLNFEKPEEVLRQKELLREEILRRQAEQAAPQGRTAEQPSTPPSAGTLRR